MQLGMVGLGRMGANMVRRLVSDGHDLVVYDVSADAVSCAGTGDWRNRRQLTGGHGLQDAAAAGDLDDGAGRLHRGHDLQAG